MKKLLLASAIVASLCASAFAQGGMGPGPGTPHTSGGGGGYTGPGDFVAYTAWGGISGLSAAAAASGTTKALTVRRLSDNATQDIVILTSGDLDEAGAKTFAGVDVTGNATSAGTTVSFTGLGSGVHLGDYVFGSGFVGTAIVSCGSLSGGNQTCTTDTSQTIGSSTAVTLRWGLFGSQIWDQTGGGHHWPQPGGSFQPRLVFGCVNNGTRPCLRSVTASMGGQACFLTTLPVYQSMIVLRSANFSTVQVATSACNSGANFNSIYYTAATNQVALYAGSSITATASDAVMHLIQGIYAASGNSTLQVDDAAATVANAGNTLTTGGGAGVFTDSNGGNQFVGDLVELGWANNTSPSGGALASVCANRRAYFGTPGSC